MVGVSAPTTQSVLYLRHLSLEASLKAISGRTSYLQVRLAFHRYPQLIPAVFNRHGFGPPRRFSCASPWPWVGHLVSGLQHATSRPFKTRFRYGSGGSLLNLATHHNSPVHYTRGTPSAGHRPYGEWHRPPTACRHTVSGTISLPSRGAFHLSLAVLVHYRSSGVFSLRRWSSRIHTGYHVSRATWERI